MHRFVGLGVNGTKIFLYEAKDGKKARQVLWGDFLNVVEDSNDGWLKVAWSRTGDVPLHLFARRAETTEVRPLEIIFLDVGQGDASILISPERGANEKIMLIDAGVGDNLDRFLAWRFKYRERELPIHAAVVTHPDTDHYEGFQPVFENLKTTFKHIYISGLLEQDDAGPLDRLGTAAKDPANGKTYQTQLLETDAQVRNFYTNPAPFGSMPYPKLMRTAIERGAAAGPIEMLSTAHGERDGNDPRTWMPGFSPGAGMGYSIEVIGPVVEPDAQGRSRLRRLESNDGKTKNGHSVILKLTYGGFTMLFGGDLNRASEELILLHYAGITRWPTKTPERAQMIASARVRLKADVLKVCHHGSSDVTDEFLQAVDPVAFVISSGDEEGHVHPRPDLLGRLGRNGRGFAPLILSTELQRSTREREDEKLSLSILAEAATLANIAGGAAETPARRQKRLDKIKDATEALGKRNVEVYGAIHVKTDGQRLIVAFRIESGAKTKLWHYYEYLMGPNNTLIATHEVPP